MFRLGDAMTQKPPPRPEPDPLNVKGRPHIQGVALYASNQSPSADNLPEDLREFRFSFLKPPKFFLSLSVPEGLYHQLRRYGISKFYEEAIDAFDGDLRGLLTASLQFMEMRKNRPVLEARCNANGRVIKAHLKKLEDIRASLEGIKNLSRAKVLAGLVQIKLNAMK